MSIEKNNLGYDSNLFIFQNKKMFNYSVDTIMLGNFVSLLSSTKRMLEIGTNNGALAIFVASRKHDLIIDAIEIQEEACKLAIQNTKLNNLEKQINVINNDFNKFIKSLKYKNDREKYDAVICNPPFYKEDCSRKSQMSEEFIIATHEVKITLEDVISGASKILKQRGYLSMVHKTERLVDIFCLMRKYNFEPKKVQFIHPRENQKSHLVLVEGRYKVGWGTFFLKNLYLHETNEKTHEYRKEIVALYKPIKFSTKRGKNE